MKTEIKGKHLSSIPVYFVNWGISFKYDHDNGRLVVNRDREFTKKILESFGFDLNDFQFKKKQKS
jgi:hypothetical protein